MAGTKKAERALRTLLKALRSGAVLLVGALIGSQAIAQGFGFDSAGPLVLRGEYFRAPSVEFGVTSLALTQLPNGFGLTPFGIGVDAPVGSNLWQVAIVSLAEFNKTSEAQRHRHVKCGGVWLGDIWVVTAAHCLEAFGARLTDLKSIEPSLKFVGVGAGSVEVSKMGTAVGVEAVTTPSEALNRQYVRLNGQSGIGIYRNDLILLELKQSLAGKGAVPALIPADTKFDELLGLGATTTALGWGFNGVGESMTNDHLTAPVLTVIGQEECIAGPWKTMVHEEMVCVGDATDKFFGDTYRYPAACPGDSGGAITQTYGDLVYVVGILSWGSPDCGDTTYHPNVGTRLSYFTAMLPKVAKPAIAGTATSPGDNAY